MKSTSPIRYLSPGAPIEDSVRCATESFRVNVTMRASKHADKSHHGACCIPSKNRCGKPLGSSLNPSLWSVTILHHKRAASAVDRCRSPLVGDHAQRTRRQLNHVGNPAIIALSKELLCADNTPVFRIDEFRKSVTLEQSRSSCLSSIHNQPSWFWPVHWPSKFAAPQNKPEP